MSKADDFKADLKDLLDKYDASIGFSVGSGSDTHGLYDERLEVSFSVKKPGARWATVDETVLLGDGWDVDGNDL